MATQKKNTKKMAVVVDTRSGNMVATAHTSYDEMSASFCYAVSDAIETHQKNHIPIAKYDGQRKQVYYLHADGRRTYEAT